MKTNIQRLGIAAYLTWLLLCQITFAIPDIPRLPRLPCIQQMIYWSDGEKHNELTIDVWLQLWEWFPEVVRHPKRWPAGSM